MFSNISGWLANGQEQEAALASGASWTGTKPTSIECISGKNLLAKTEAKALRHGQMTNVYGFFMSGS